MHNFNQADATAISEMVRADVVSAEAVAEHFLGCVEAGERSINAFVSFDPDAVRSQACQLKNGNAKGLLAGVPVGIKDVYDTVDHPTRFYSPIYEQNRPSRDAHVVALLRQAGAVIMGKTHTTEFAYMHTGPTRNPHDLARTPGSSSAGSAAGMAAGFFPLALGTQTAGSLIKPAAYCGLYAFKPSYGLVSLEGVKPLAPSFDTVGWYGRSVRDLEVMARAPRGGGGPPLRHPGVYAGILGYTPSKSAPEPYLISSRTGGPRGRPGGRREGGAGGAGRLGRRRPAGPGLEPPPPGGGTGA